MTDMAKPVFAVVLSGCGVMDGSEIHETVLALLAIDRQGGVAQCFAPDIDQLDVIDHRTQRAVAGERRNVLAESARIARGRIKPLSAFDPAKADGLVFPGGYGAAKNLCSFALDGPDCTIDPDVERAIRGMAAAGKPIGALCIAPVLLARLLAPVEVTVGNDAGTASAIEQMGARHRVAGHGEVVIDRVRKVVSCPCYMLDATVSQIADDAHAAVAAMLEMMG
ncbi:MAG: isoprenoid biosynthesis glyoxalase ElbB [Magnetospirillum sp.]|nr:isoprenoid biosynthesis glyoxalase ElbB [Magnetospirillum sp.]